RLKNARIFDGVGSALIDGRDVLVHDGRIKDIIGAADTVSEAEVIDCGGGTLMPGMIDAHWHSILAGISQATAMTADIPYIHLVAAQEAERTVLRGFTTVRDVGGPSFALKRAIDEGRLAGPRIYPSGAMISDRKSTRLNSSHVKISYAVFCLKKKKVIVCIQHDHYLIF